MSYAQLVQRMSDFSSSQCSLYSNSLYVSNGEVQVCSLAFLISSAMNGMQKSTGTRQQMATTNNMERNELPVPIDCGT